MTTFSWLVVVPAGAPVQQPVTGVTLDLGPTTEPRKVEELKRLVPRAFEVGYGSNLGALLYALGYEDHRVTEGDISLVVRGTRLSSTLTYVAKKFSTTIRVQHLLSSVGPVTESVGVSGEDITVTLGLDAGGNITSTPTSIKALIEALPAANALVRVVLTGTGAGVPAFTRALQPLEPDGLQGLRNDTFLRTARGEALRIAADNYGISAPVRLGLSDEATRLYAMALAYQAKNTLKTLYKLLTAILGDQVTAKWDVFLVRKKTIVVEIPDDQFSAKVASATYVRELSTTVSIQRRTGDYIAASPVDAAYPRTRFDVAPAAVGDPTNNSVYVRTPTKLALLEALDVVRAAGVKLEVVSRRN